METNYEKLSRELKDYIQFSCPYKIGDRVHISSLYRSYNSADNEVSHHGEVIDIQVSTKRQVLYRNGLADVIRTLENVEGANDILNEPVPEFTITYKYKEVLPRENRLEFWKQPETREVISSIIVDCYSNNVQRGGSVRKNIEKE